MVSKQELSLAYKEQGEIYNQAPKKSTQVKLAQINSVLKRLDYNFSYIFPFLYPKYIADDDGGWKPLNFIDQPFSAEMSHMNCGTGETVVMSSRQVGKSTLISSLIDSRCSLIPRYSAVYVSPRRDQAQTFAYKAKEMAEQNIFYLPYGPTKERENVYSRFYENGSNYRIFNQLTTADNIRGPTCDFLQIDEQQDFDGSLYNAVIQIAGRSKFRQINISGTAKGVDTFLYEKFQYGSQGSHHIKCEHCNHDNDTFGLADDEVQNVLKMIRPQGLCCQKCGKLLDQSKSFIVHRFPSKQETNFYSIHAPKIVIPRIQNSITEWNNTYLQFKTGDLIKFIQEELGLPQEVSQRELTKQDLVNCCVLNKEQSQTPQNRQKYRYIISGIDWGGSDFNPQMRQLKSMTQHVVVGVTVDRKYEVIHMKAYEGMQYQNIIQDILRYHSQLNGQIIVADNQGGNWYIDYIKKHSNTRLITVQIQDNPRIREQIRKTQSGWQECWTIKKTENLSNLFALIKQRKFSFYEWDRQKNELQHFLNIVRQIHDTGDGQGKRFHYRVIGTKCNDIQMAVMFAVVCENILTGHQPSLSADAEENFRANLPIDMQDDDDY